MKSLVLVGATLVIFTGAAYAQDQEDVAEGAKVFKKCAACHAVGEGAKNKVGPQLNGVVGRTAGSLPDYNYSQPMKDAGAGGLVWNEETIDDYLEKPKEFVKGNKMAFVGLKKEDEREHVIDYLKTFSAAATQ
jgi:cytochrome c